MSIKATAGLALAFFSVVGMTATAAPITYDFTGSSTGLPTGNLFMSSVTVSSGGLDLTVNGIDEFGNAGSLARNDQDGLGVVGEPGVGLDTNKVGANNDGAESLEFDFSPASVAIIESAVFETGFEAGSLDVFADEVFLETISWLATDGGGTQGNSTVTYAFTSSLGARTAQKFRFEAVADAFRLKTITVDPVPEPTCLVLALMGLAGALGSRKQRLRSA